MDKQSSGQLGFTLIELMVTVAIAAIVMALAIPSFTTMIKNIRLTSQTNALVSSLNLARSEAIKRGIRVSLCKSTDGATCTTANDWSRGWIIFVDINENDARDLGETVLKIQAPADSQISTVGNGNVIANRVNFKSDGGSTANGTINVCDERIDPLGNVGNSIAIATTGHVRLRSTAERVTNNNWKCL